MSDKRSDGRLRDPERSREAILQAAEQLFAQKGYESTSLQEIGTLAGVSRGTPGYFFGSKEQLYQSVLDRILKAEHDAAEQVHERLMSSGAAPVDIITEVIRSHIDFLVARPTFLQLLTREALSNFAQPQSTTTLEVIQAGRVLLTHELDRADIHHVDPDILLLSVVALCWMPLTHRETLLKPLAMDVDDPAFIERLKEHVVSLLLHGILHQ